MNQQQYLQEPKKSLRFIKGNLRINQRKNEEYLEFNAIDEIYKIVLFIYKIFVDKAIKGTVVNRALSSLN